MSRKTVDERAIKAMWRALPRRNGVSGPDVVKRAIYRSAYLRDCRPGGEHHNEPNEER